MEVRTPEVGGDFFPIRSSYVVNTVAFPHPPLQTILYGIERAGGATPDAVFSCHLHPDDCDGAVDLSVCSTQNAQRVSGDRLHAAHARRCCMLVE